ncbi:MAG: RNA polymerase factor sigma-54 [Pseudomonadota bacterium]
MLKPSLQLRIGQTLTMTPQLQQAIRLLQLPVAELQSQIQEALESNVMLESIEDDGGPADNAAESALDTSPAAPEQAKEPVASAESDPAEAYERSEATTDPDRDTTPEREPVDESWDRGVSAAETRGSGGEAPVNQDYADLSGETLGDHLLWQLEFENFSPREVVIGQAIVDAINDDGYLTEDLETIHGTLLRMGEVSLEEVEQVLAKVQTLEPVGVASRNLAECLTLQLRQLDAQDGVRDLAIRIVQEHLELLAEHQHAALRRRLNVSESDLEHAIALVHTLQPRPGAGLNTQPPEYVVPDVYVRKVDGQWIVDLNAGMTTSIRVNQTYAQQIARGAEHSTLRSQLQEARWLVRSLEIRNETLMKVARAIVQRQKDFLDRGDEGMSPMVLRDIAEELDMHESTISRVTTNKYMHTPRGIIEFRYFFSSHIGTDDGGELSSVAIRAKIRKLIASENSAKALSDNKIAQTLSEAGINVARRTVAKYREAMSIPSSSERKKLARIQQVGQGA